MYHPPYHPPWFSRQSCKISVIPPLLEKGQSQNYGASTNYNGLLTLSGLLSLKFLLHMTNSFIKENHFNNGIQAIRGVQNYNKTWTKHIVVEAKVNHDTQFYTIKGRVGVLPPSSITFETVDEILWILLQAWPSSVTKFSYLRLFENRRQSLCQKAFVCVFIKLSSKACSSISFNAAKLFSDFQWIYTDLQNSAYNAVSSSWLRTLDTCLLINASLRKTRQRPDSYQYLLCLMKTFTMEFVEKSWLIRNDFMHQSIPSTIIRPPGNFFKVVKFPAPGRKFLRNYGPGAKK